MADNPLSRRAAREEIRSLAHRALRQDFATLKLLAPFAWPADDPRLRWRIVICAALVGLASLITAIAPMLFSIAIDAYAGKASPWLVTPLGVLAAYAATSWIGRVLGQLYFVVYGPIEHGLVRRISRVFFDHLHGLSLRFHLGRRTGAMSEILGRGLGGVREIVNNAVFQLGPLVIELGTIGLIIFFRLSPLFAAIVAITLFAFAAVLGIGGEDLRRTIRRMNQAQAQAHGEAIDSLINYETVKYFGAERAIGRRYDSRLAEVETLAVRGLMLRAFSGMAQMTVLSLGLAVLLVLGGLDVARGELSVGDLVLINTYLLRLARPLETLGRILRSMRTSLANVEQLFELLQERPEIRDAPDAVPLPAGTGHIRLEKVSFGYDPRRPILTDISLDLPAGETLAIVGPSGAGKSTIARLLFRFYDPTDGRILMDGADLRAVTQDSLRAAIAVVPQDTVLFNETIFDNIAFARVGASREEVEQAARAAQLAPFIASLPDGWDTLVGERGLKLSGGEKQRVAIARAILKRPRVFVFDEATSALDSATEQAIQAEITALSRGTTTVMVAHRLSTIIHADTIIVLDGGRIVERGRHAELVRAGGAYARLWQRQQDSRIEGSEDR